MKKFIDSTSNIDHLEELASRFEEHGYLFIRSFLLKNKVQQVQNKIFEKLKHHNWIIDDPNGSGYLANNSQSCTELDPEYEEVYRDLYKIPEIHSLGHDQNIEKLMQGLLGDDILVHPGLVVRVCFPNGPRFTTPAHQDYIPVQGTMDTITLWTPLVAINDQLGGLQISAGSHKFGIFDFKPHIGPGCIEVTDKRHLENWHSGHLQMGDIILFHSCTVHAGLPNLSDQLRVSIDIRYQRRNDSINPYSLKPSLSNIDWQDIYEGWSDKKFQYYWEKSPLNIKEYDHSFNDLRDEMAFEMAREQNKNATSTLKRILMSQLPPEKKQMARQLLEKLEKTN